MLLYGNRSKRNQAKTVKVRITCIFAFQGCPNNVRQTRMLKVQELIFSQFWRLEVRDHVGTRLVSPEVFLSCRQNLLSLSLNGLLSVSASQSLYKDARYIGIEPINIISFYLNYLFRGPNSKESHILDVTISAYEF